jgi:hypothetical protein
MLADVVDALPSGGSYGQVFALSNAATAVGFVLGPLLGSSGTELVGFRACTVTAGVACVCFSLPYSWAWSRPSSSPGAPGGIP